MGAFNAAFDTFDLHRLTELALLQLDQQLLHLRRLRVMNQLALLHDVSAQVEIESKA
jgi:hypothetical protein